MCIRDSYYTTSVKQVDYSLSAATLDQIFNLRVGLTTVLCDPLNDYVNTYLENFSRIEIQSNSNKHASYTLLFSKPRLLHYMLVRTAYPRGIQKSYCLLRPLEWFCTS